MATKKDYSIFNNSRFYILCTTVLFSLMTAAFLRIAATSDQFFYIRLEQVFGLLCILYWYVALAISPVGYVVGKQRMAHIEFARRAIGVSAAYFALLHAGVAFWGQLGGFAGISHLPDLFKWSLGGGFLAVVILLIMALTSFDKVISFMTFRRWKWLHRLVYGGGILAVLHIWSVGTHLSYSAVQIAAAVMLIVLAGLESFRVVTLFARKYPDFKSKDYFIGAFLSLWTFWTVIILIIPSVVQSHHGAHHSTPEQSETRHE